MPEPDWSRSIILNGYRLVFCPDHPNAWKVNFTGYVYEHRLVVERRIGRLLARTEIVHHRDQDRLNNAPENLEVMTQAEHARQHQLARRHPDQRLKCARCGQPFVRRNNQRASVKGYARAYCSRRCNGIANGFRPRSTMDRAHAS